MKKIIFSMLALSLITGTICCQQKIDNEKERIVMANNYVKAWNEGDLSLLEEVLSPESIRHHVDISEDIIGIEAIKGYVTLHADGFPRL